MLAVWVNQRRAVNGKSWAQVYPAYMMTFTGCLPKVVPPQADIQPSVNKRLQHSCDDPETYA